MAIANGINVIHADAETSSRTKRRTVTMDNKTLKDIKIEKGYTNLTG